MYYENNDVTLFREVNCKIRLFAMKYSIEVEEKINEYNSLCFHGKSLLITLHLGEISSRKSSELYLHNVINEQWIHTVAKIYKNTYNMNYVQMIN